MEFYKCKKCGNIIAYAEKCGCNVKCCNEEMAKLECNITDVGAEKHIPVINVTGNTVEVRVGCVQHPMTEEHSISWVAIETEMGNQRKILKPNGSPIVMFALTYGDKIKKAYAYCNLHGLWSKEI